MSRTALSYCSQSVKDRFLLAIFQHLNLVSCVGLSSVASRKRVQRYGLLWNWQAFTTFFFKKTAFFLHFSSNRTANFLLRYFLMWNLRHQGKNWDSLISSIFRRFFSRTGVRTKKKPIKTDKNRWKHLFCDLDFAAKRPVRKTKENIGKQKKTCFFLFLFFFFKVFPIGASGARGPSFHFVREETFANPSLMFR